MKPSKFQIRAFVDGFQPGLDPDRMNQLLDQLQAAADSTAMRVIEARQPDPNRWNVEQLAESGAEEDRALAELGLAEWGDAFDEEDRR